MILMKCNVMIYIYIYIFIQGNTNVDYCLYFVLYFILYYYGDNNIDE